MNQEGKEAEESDKSEDIETIKDEEEELRQDNNSKLKETVAHTKKTYYRVMFSIYFGFCFLLAFNYHMIVFSYSSSIELLVLSLFMAIGFAILIPIFILVTGLASGGLAYLIVAPIGYAMLNSSTKGVMKILGFDIDLLFPNLVGKTGYVSKHSLLGNKAKYPFSAVINNTGLYGDSFFYKNLFSVRSSEKLEIGMQVEVTQNDKWTLLSIIKHHPTLAVVPIPGEYHIESGEKVLETAEDVLETHTPLELKSKLGIRWVMLQIILVFLATFVVLMGFYQSVQCSSSSPICNTLIDGMPFFILSFILLTVAIRTEYRRTLLTQEPLEKAKINAASSRKVKTRMAVLAVVFSLILGPLWYIENRDYNDDIVYKDLDEDCNDTVVGPDINLVNADFSDMYLYGCDLSNRDLTGADFSNAYLKCVDFSNSILVGADFGSSYYVDSYGYITYQEGPDIMGATFDNADLSGVNFNGLGYSPVSTGPYYSVPENISCDWQKLSFKGTNLTNADINAYFQTKWGGDKLIFDNAILDNSNFMMMTTYLQVSMVNVSFIGTDISMHLPSGTNLNLSQSNMSEANFIDFMALDLSSCPLSLPENYNCLEISGKKMIFGSGMDFSNNIYYYDPDSLNTNGPDLNFSGLDLPNSIFHGVLLSGSDMSYTNLSNSNFTYNHKMYDEQYLDYHYWWEDTDEENRTYLEAVLDEWGVDNFSDFKSLWSANLTNVDFTGANLSYSDFSYSNMLDAKLENATLTGAKWYYTICPDGTNSGKTGSCNIT